MTTDGTNEAGKRDSKTVRRAGAAAAGNEARAPSPPAPRPAPEGGEAKRLFGCRRFD